MDAADLRFLLSLIYVFPSYILYGCLFYTIFFSVACDKFSGSFYTLFGLSTVYNVFYSFFYYIDIQFGKIPFLIPFVKTWGTRGFMVTFFHLMSWYFIYVLHLSNCLLAFNRLTVFALKVGYQRFWDRYLKVLLGIPLLLPILFVWHIPFTDIYVQLENEADSDSTRFITEGNANAIPWMDNPRNSSIFIISTSIISFIMNAYVITKLMQQKFCFSSKVTNVQQKKVSSKDIQMTIYTLLIFVIEVITAVFLFILMTAKDFDFITLLFNIQVYLTDITTLAPAWFVLATNKSLRKQIAYYFGIIKSAQNENSMTVPGTVITAHSRQQTSQIRGIK